MGLSEFLFFSFLFPFFLLPDLFLFSSFFLPLGTNTNVHSSSPQNRCYCGSVINTASGAKKISCDIAKLMTCGGDVKQFCGGSSLLNLYSSGT